MAGVYTIRPGLPFVDALAAGLLAEASAEPLALADMLVLLPTRRACRSLREAFLRQSGAGALLLPQIQPLGDIGEDELLDLGPLELELPPAIGGLRRQVRLARLVAVALDVPFAQALRLAEALARFLDETQTQRTGLDGLGALVPEALAEHWQLTLDFLQILRRQWPEILAEEGLLDPAARRDALLAALAARWRDAPLQRRIVAAGSTGSIPATRDLLAVIARLPQGAVVLPGLDRLMDEESWARLEPSHPQHGLRQLLEALAVGRADVAEWPAPGVAGSPPARAALLAEVMRPAATSDAWQTLPPPPAEALAGLAVVTAPDQAAEAQLLAMKLREALERPGRTAALVTPDRSLARRVAVELLRFGIEVDDSAGLPLDQTPQGGFLLLTAHMVVDQGPLPLLAALKHPLAQGGMEQGAFRRLVRRLELKLLRGPRVQGGLAGLLRELDALRGDAGRRDREELDALRAWLGEIAAAARPFAELAGAREAALGELLCRHGAFAEWLARDQDGSPGGLFAREAGEAAQALLGELLEAAADAPPVAPAAYPGLLALLMAGRPVRPRHPRHPRLHIWGQLEARLQQADMVLLAGLDEGVWPADGDPGPWLSRPMRAALGLPPPEQAVGLAAHDFVQAACAPEVVLSRALKDAAGKPTVPSRWLVRLDAVLGAAGGEARPWLDPAWLAWQDGLDRPPAHRPGEPPAPRPPLAARPRALPVTDIELWMRDPYALYAKRILSLRPLEPLDADPSFPERGQIVHRALERFVRAFPEHLPNDALDRLLAIGAEVFRDFGQRPQLQALWWPRFTRIARWFVELEQERRRDLERVLAEAKGELVLRDFKVTARADRLERLRGGGVRVLDYKTGTAPSGAMVDAFIAPQLPLEGAIAKAGGFEGLERGDILELAFVQLKGGEPPGEIVQAIGRRGQRLADPEDAVARARARLASLVARFDDPRTPYLARPQPRYAPRSGDYDHLERLQEWAEPGEE